MGTLGAIGMADAATHHEITLEQSLAWHLRSNHFPPVPLSMIPACIAAIDAANADDWNDEIPLPDNTSYRGRDTAPAWAIIDAHHLDAWVSDDESAD